MRPIKGVGIPLALCDSADGIDEQRSEVCEWAKCWIAWRGLCCERPAAIFDIDATLLHINDQISSVVSLYNATGRLGITRFIITARSDDGKEYTRKELQHHNIAQPRHLFMHPQHEPCASSVDAGRMKACARKRIADKGYTVILNVGDAFHDHYSPPTRRDI